MSNVNKNNDKYCVEANMTTHNLMLKPCDKTSTSQRITKYSPNAVVGTEITPYPPPYPQNPPCIIM